MGLSAVQRSETLAVWLACFVGAAVVLLWVYPRQDGAAYVHEEEDDGDDSDGQNWPPPTSYRE